MKPGRFTGGMREGQVPDFEVERTRYADKAVYFDTQSEAPWSAREYGLDEQRKLGRLFDHLGPLSGLNILEPGCGSGRLTEILAGRVSPGGRVLGLEISAKMARAARERTKKRPEAEIVYSSVEAAGLGPDEFDLVICHQVFPHFENKEEALKILARSLKPGGRFIVFHFINFNEINDLHRKTGTAVEKDLMPEQPAMRRLLEKAGLRVEFIKDDEQGYFCSAIRDTRGTRPDGK